MTKLHDVSETFAIRAGGAPRSLMALGVLGAFAGSACSPPPPPAPARAPVQAEPERSPWPEAPPAPESVVHAEFQTSARAVKPKGKFWIAVRFDIAEGYRISWLNPGDVGKTTRVRFEVPEGFLLGALAYPAPRRFQLPGNLVSYGYERQTAIFAEVTAPERVPDGRTFRFDVKADWLACKDDCSSEELSAWFELASSALAPEPELPPELAPHLSALPLAFAALPDSNLDWEGGARPALTLKASEVKWLDFFPADAEQPKLLSITPGDELCLKFASASTSQPVRGLAVAEVNGKTAFYDVDVPFPTR
jgi:hypothetical protein